MSEIINEKTANAALIACRETRKGSYGGIDLEVISFEDGFAYYYSFLGGRFALGKGVRASAKMLVKLANNPLLAHKDRA